MLLKFIESSSCFQASWGQAITLVRWK